jgi:hypothetical protein
MNILIELAKQLEIPHVNIVNDNFIFNHSVSELLTLATIKSVENNKVEEEGFVFIMNDKNVSFKVINPNYLLGKEKKEK